MIHGTAERALLPDQEDPLVRVAAARRTRTAPVPVGCQRRAGSAPSARRATALATVGRVLRTRSLLRSIHDATLRGRMQLQVNRGERRHQRARRLFVANPGAFQPGDSAESLHKTTCRSWRSNAGRVWTPVHRTRLIAQRRATGATIADAAVARIAPAALAHVLPTGT